ncbi:MAG TPA: YihY/virulence factor BrkB family protein [Phototrophicaceae bacterium]|nr:YihY/virulence factor BrkB family protein [Phototrophicaceae bacterium]
MLPVAVVLVGLGCAVAARRWPVTAERLSPAATTILAVLGGTTAGLTALDGGLGPLAVVAALLAAGALVLAGAAVNARALRPLRARTSGRPGLADRLEAWAERHHVGPARTNLLAVVVRAWRRATAVRVTGLAAEMTYYGLISLVPLLTALGASLGFLERFAGAAAVTRIEQTLVDGVSTVFAEQVAADVLAPLIRGLLREERAGVALGSVLVALWLASRMFRAAIRALDDAYRVPERRTLVGQYALGIALALGAVLTLLVLLALVVVGPLLGDGRELADRFGLGSAFEISWSVARWPALAAVTTTYLTVLYRYGPNVRTTWSRCLPGAVVGTVGVVLVAVGFSAYLALAGPSAPGAENVQGAAVTAAAQAIGLVLAGVVWLWLSSIVVLAGGVLNAELARAREGRQQPRTAG